MQRASPATPSMEDPIATQLAIGMAEYQKGVFARAGDIFGALAAIEPDHPVVLRMLGLCRLNTGATEDAVDLLARAFEIQPNDAATRMGFATALLTAGRAGDAVPLLRDCVGLFPNDHAAPLNLAAALLRVGDHAAARAAARKARARAPLVPQTHHTLGMAELAGGQLAAAEAAFRDAVRIAPDFADAWLNLGVVLYRRADLAGAAAATARALQAAPGHAAAAANLAAFLRLAGDADGAERLLEHSIEHGAETGAARLNLAATWLGENRPGDALTLLGETPPERAAEHVQWALHRANALLALDRDAEAQGTLDGVTDIPRAMRPLVLWARIQVADKQHDTGTVDDVAAEMQAELLDNDEILPEHRIMGCFDLAGLRAARGAHAAAFALWTQGHRLLARFQPFSRDDHAAFVDASIAAFDATSLAADSGADDPSPVFIVGMPRSGTTLMEQILAAHRDVAAMGERTALGDVFTRLGGAVESADAARKVAAAEPAVLAATAEDYLRSLRGQAEGAARVTDKMPGNVRFLGLIRRMLPGARIIYCARDPRDIAFSIFTYRFYGHHPYAHDLGDLGWYIVQHARQMRHWQATMPERLLTVRLEDWVHDFAGTLRRVLAFLDLPYDEACERFYEADRRVATVSRDQVRSPVNDRGLGRYRPYEALLEPAIAQFRAAGLLAE